MTAFNIGNNIQELTFYKLQQQTQQLIQQQNAYLAALQLARSQSVSAQSHTHNHQSMPTTTNKPPVQRSLSDISPYYHCNQRAMDTISNANARSPPGLSPPATSPTSQNASVMLAPLPQTPCISLQRRDSVKSDTSLQGSTESRYKTEMCRPFEETGRCKYGSKCQFSHGVNELRGLNRHPKYKTELCHTFHTRGLCTYGQRCNFIHNEDERRPAQPVAMSTTRPQGLQLNKHMPLTLTNSSGSSPASSVYGDMSPSHSPSYLSDDPFTASTSSRLSPAPSLGSFASDLSNRSFPSPPSTPPHHLDEFSSDKHLLSPSLDLSSLLSSLSFRQ